MWCVTSVKNKPLQPEYIITVQSRAWRYFHVISLFILTTRERPYMSRTTDKSAKTVTAATIALLKPFGKAVKTITTDNGKEFA